MRQYLYKEGCEPIIVDGRAKKSKLNEGWYESPVSFIKTTDFNCDPDDKIKVQQLCESIEGIKDCLNGMLNLSKMKLSELRDFAYRHYDESMIDIRTKKNAIIRINELSKA